ncbi:MAG: NAD(P)H-dependent oxidoreductase [Sedimentisphaerales bacterium]|nr:NAD(P)H-dependent oxidoreductase [Sedimentisphaerales bacterium]
MSRLLYIQSSPRKLRSKSNAAADAFVETYLESHPGDEVVTVNLFEAPLPAFDLPAVQAKYAILHGRQPEAKDKAVWGGIERIIKEFKSADKYVISVPMWNFGIPYRLKQYLDIIIQPGLTFSFSPDKGYQGLVTGKPVFVVYARGGDYSGPGAEGADFQKRYLEFALKFIGFDQIQSVVVEPTLMGGPEAAQEKLDGAIKEAQEIAAGF